MNHVSHKILISIGSNTQRKRQMALARKLLEQHFPDIRFTRSLSSEACDSSVGIYSNMLAEFTTILSESDLVSQLKSMEREMGDTLELRREGKVMMDLDLLRYDEGKRHERDWHQPYIMRLLRYALRLIVIVTILTHGALKSFCAEPSENALLLGKAIDYYQGGKYHESILAFERLSKSHNLNPRFMAYLGMSYYKELQYKEAIKYLSKSLPHLGSYSPQERAVYAYSCAESLFHLERYTESIAYYEQALPLVEGNNRADVLFHNAFAHYLTEGVNNTVTRLFSDALQTYKANAATATSQQAARLKQTETMLRAMRHAEPRLAQPSDID